MIHFYVFTKNIFILWPQRRKKVSSRKSTVIDSWHPSMKSALFPSFFLWIYVTINCRVTLYCIRDFRLLTKLLCNSAGKCMGAVRDLVWTTTVLLY